VAEITDDHLKRIGRITVEFAQLEYRFGSIVQELTDKEPAGYKKVGHKFEDRKNESRGMGFRSSLVIA